MTAIRVPSFLLPAGALVALLPVLAACGSGAEGGNGTAITVSGGGARADTSAKGGGVAIAVPGFKANVDLPGLKVKAKDLDLAGMKPYPGTEVERIDISKAPAESGEKRAIIAFTAPADAARVRGWFVEQGKVAGFALAGEAMTLAGTGPEGEQVEMRFADAGPGRSRGEISFVKR
ncbi:hypothetical protein GVO57_03595 [Sphingomonas changnyeongensis]|uniref:Lipoprotein n=1 Tax=Sphingomonas changnyeongensis TaxID=2698679 RepID=A0A7Z2NV23_9SPHN|nr:hypothetical protein [Sphingomonas changnyeongensis]QHL90077.1 hypothetical protein GVO57_03595 [Sphingomonas changnyeongensis]